MTPGHRSRKSIVVSVKLVETRKVWSSYFYFRGLLHPSQNYLQGGRLSNRLFYLSIPPNIFVDAVKCASSSASSLSGWTRVIVEKPFGRDSKTSATLTNSLKHYLEEDQIFRWEILSLYSHYIVKL